MALATLATIIASQAVISGAYSVARQAERWGFLPRLTVRQTSEQAGGQIYIASVNWLLFAGVVILLLTFRESGRLAVAYGVAVTAMLLVTTALFAVYALLVLRWNRWQVAAFVLVFGSIEAVFFTANITKLVHGGWLPILVALAVALVMTTWWRGRELVTARREKIEGPLPDFLAEVARDSAILRVPGTAVFLHPNKRTAPLALRENVRFNHVIHDEVLIVTVESTTVPHVPESERAVLDDLGDPYAHIRYLTLRYGFSDHPDVPAGILAAVAYEDLDIRESDTTYFVSRITVNRSDRPGMNPHRKKLFSWLAHNAADPTHYYSLPVARTVVVGAQVNY